MGPNGAGKTTFVKCIAGLERYCGSIEISAPRDKIFIVWDDTPFYINISGIDNIKIFVHTKWSKKSEEVVNKFFSQQKLRQKVKYFSYGEKKKLALVVAILNDPEILLMDEVTNGLDYETLCLLKDYIVSLSENRLVILTGHQLTFYEDLPIDTVVVVCNGELEQIEKADGYSLEGIYNEKISSKRN